MAKTWDYAELSRIAKQYGGPEKFLEIIKSYSKQTGIAEGIRKGISIGVEEGIKLGKGKMLPIVVLALAGGAAAGGVAVYYAVSRKFTEGKQIEQITEAEAAAAEAILIEEMKKAEQHEDLGEDDSPKDESGQK